ncbi:MAG: hypothetical protein DRP79_07865 [Planctomycetota bacterium]|nr:MAG: hypothetical protein DRP79_07865 [Planctomycetota bacterium]
MRSGEVWNDVRCLFGYAAKSVIDYPAFGRNKGVAVIAVSVLPLRGKGRCGFSFEFRDDIYLRISVIRREVMHQRIKRIDSV